MDSCEANGGFEQIQMNILIPTFETLYNAETHYNFIYTWTINTFMFLIQTIDK